MSKRDSDKAQNSPPTPDPTVQITDSQILGKPEAAPPAASKKKRRSTTHGVGWYAAGDESGELRRPSSVRTWKTIALVAALVALAALAGIIYMSAR